MMFLKRWFGSLYGQRVKYGGKETAIRCLTHCSENLCISQVVRYNFSEFREMPAVPFLFKSHSLR